MLHLRRWSSDLGCMGCGDTEEEVWVKVVGLLVHLWNRKVLKRIRDACRGFVAFDEDTTFLTELFRAKILVRIGESALPKMVEVVVGDCQFSIQLWRELPHYLRIRPIENRGEKMKGALSKREEDGDTRAGERVSLGGRAR